MCVSVCKSAEVLLLPRVDMGGMAAAFYVSVSQEGGEWPCASLDTLIWDTEHLTQKQNHVQHRLSPSPRLYIPFVSLSLLL